MEKPNYKKSREVKTSCSTSLLWTEITFGYFLYWQTIHFNLVWSYKYQWDLFYIHIT